MHVKKQSAGEANNAAYSYDNRGIMILNLYSLVKTSLMLSPFTNMTYVLRGFNYTRVLLLVEFGLV